jgi:hypothetical protein
VETPRHEHDCEECVFLGRYRGRHAGGGDAFGDADLYFCVQGVDCPTVIARGGGDGPCYSSGLVFPLKHPGWHPELDEAFRRAVALGLLTQEGELCPSS